MSTVYPWTSMKTSDGTPMGTVFSPSLGDGADLSPSSYFAIANTRSPERNAGSAPGADGPFARSEANLTHLRETYEEIATTAGNRLPRHERRKPHQRTKEADAYIVYLEACAS